MADDHLPDTLQHSILAVLCFEEGHGAAIAAQIKAEHFDNAYRDFATQLLTYRKRHRRPPGRAHLPDLIERAFGGRDAEVVRKRFTQNLLASKEEGLNPEYTLARVQDFVQLQSFKEALMAGSDRFGQNDDGRLTDLRNIFRKALDVSQETFNPGIYLNDEEAAFRFLDKRKTTFVSLRIPELDNKEIGLVPKELLLYIAPKGSGKSWFCVHCGRQALMQRLKVVHFSLELSDDQIIGRYWQAIAAAARRPEKYNRTWLEFDELQRLTGFKTKKLMPKLDFQDPKIRMVLRSKLKAFGIRLGGLLVKSFPTGSLTIDQINAHLDYLVDIEGFVPDVLIVDYPKLMKMGDARYLRVALGRTMEELRGIGVQRNVAIVAPHQGTRASIDARKVKSSMAGEDISVVQTADTVLAFSRTSFEKERGLGRLSVEHARDSLDGFTVLLTQSYDTGQYVLESALMQNAYWDRVKALSDDEEEDDDD